MTRSPGIELCAEPAGSWEFEGPLSSRVERLVAHLQRELLANGIRVRPARIRVLHAPLEHVGLGVGTQLSLAVARVLLRLAGTPEPAVEELARLTGRGDRSGIGLHGFQSGGLILDGGRTSATAVPPLVARLAFPEDWTILIVQPPDLCGLHGSDESRAFAELPAIAGHITDRLCRIVLVDLLPAIVDRDLSRFGAALSELQAHVGAIFAPAQGGTFTTPRAATIVEELRRSGFVGIGQSSWGPTLYAFSDQPQDELCLRADHLRRQLALEGTAVLVTRADNQGASVVVEG
jgi:beta-RFAP synthase